MNLIETKKLKKYFPVKSGIFSRVINHVKAVDDVDLNIEKGTTLGLVGESGCGKSTLGKTIIKLLNPTSGKIVFDNQDITELSTSEIRPLRKNMQMIFQNPYGSLNPRMSVESLITEGMHIHNLYSNSERTDVASELLEKVGLTRSTLNKYPHEFSGGQRQRIAIARALAVQPTFIVCDEPVSALDVSVQAQIVNLLISLQQEFNLTYLFISHDLRVVKHISNNVAVMYLGKIVEISSSEELYTNPLHPYTKILISAIPDIKNKKIDKKAVISGDVPSPIDPPKGCSFHPRCPIAEEKCKTIEPKLTDKGGKHMVSCHLV
ncbi:MAG: ABC transporter ATP-binding protein [Thermodesulfobacteriota bacterium]